MVSVKPSWWHYVRHIVREYPGLCQELEEIKLTRVTINYGIHTRTSGQVLRPVEAAALGTLAPSKQKKYMAVREAINLTKARHPNNGENRMKIIEMVYFTEKCNITGAALALPCHVNTASRWQAEFLRLVAELLELP